MTDAAAEQLRFAWDTEVFERRAGGDDDRFG